MLQTAFPVALPPKMILANFLKTIGCLGVRNSILVFDVITKKGKKFFVENIGK